MVRGWDGAPAALGALWHRPSGREGAGCPPGRPARPGAWHTVRRAALLGWVFSMLPRKWGRSSGWMAQRGRTSTALLPPPCHPGCSGLCWAQRGVQGGTHTREAGENAARWDPSLACIPRPAPTVPTVMTTTRSPQLFPAAGPSRSSP